MNYELTEQQVKSYRDNGFLVVENFLSPAELEDWRAKVMAAVNERAGVKMPGKDLKTGEDDGINEDSEYFGKVFDQLINLWQTN
ncbi:MAG TPA: phytanoyl-CoA dioxygenase family protein, partial [Puia sp.]